MQLSEYFANFLSKFQCGFRQGFGTQYCLLVMIEKSQAMPITYCKAKPLWF